MAPAPSSAGSGPAGFVQPVSLRRRATSLALALLANALLLLMLFTLAPAPTPPAAKRPPTTFTLLPEGDDTPAKTAAQPERKRSAAAPRTPRATPQPTPPASDIVVPEPPPINMIVMSREAYAASDISRLPSAPAPAGGDAGTGEERAGDSEMAAGRAPGGEPLYNAEWYREPTAAELSGYLPSSNPRSGWGTIACRTVANYRVDDCVELGQSPPGSGLARAVRLAAWQFRVRPPRKGGKSLVGAWVSIRIDYSQKLAD